MRQSNKFTHRLKIEMLLLTISMLVFICYLTIPKLIAKSHEPTNKEIEAWSNTLYPCGNHTYSYTEPILIDGKYTSENTEVYINVCNNQLKIHGSKDDIMNIVNANSKLLSNESSDLTYEDWISNFDVTEIMTLHFFDDNPDLPSIADKTIIRLEIKGKHFRPALIYEYEDKKIVFGDVAFIYDE